MTLSAPSSSPFVRRASDTASRIFGSKALPWIVIGAGLIVRAYQYLMPRALWYDEARLALNRHIADDRQELVAGLQRAWVDRDERHCTSPSVV